MYASLRSPVTTGIALVGAGVIAVAPIGALPCDVRIARIPIANSEVRLTAAPSPIEYYPQVLLKALGNTQTLLQQYLSAGSAYIGALVADPGRVLQNTVLFSVLQLVPPIPFAYVAIASSPVLNGIGAAAVALKDVSDAAAAANPVDLVNAIVDIPARILDGVLNGGYPFDNSGTVGLLTPYTPYEPSGPFALPLFLVDLVVSYGTQTPPPPPTPLNEVGTNGNDPTSQKGAAVDSAGHESLLDDSAPEHSAVSGSRPLSVVTKHITDAGDAVKSVLGDHRSTMASADDDDVENTPLRDAVREARSDRKDDVAMAAAGLTRKTPIREAVKNADKDLKNAVTRIGTSTKKALAGANPGKADAGDS